MKIFILFCLVLFTSSLYAQERGPQSDYSQVHSPLGAGSEVGNGGDGCESEIISIREKIKTWIQKGLSKQLNLPPDISHREYKESMLDAIDSASIECVYRPLEVRGLTKTCINSRKEGESRITCNHLRFLEMKDNQKHVLIHHEFAGLAGFETSNQYGSSGYKISNQLHLFLKKQGPWKLVSRKSLNSTDSIKAATEYVRNLGFRIRMNSRIPSKSYSKVYNLIGKCFSKVFHDYKYSDLVFSEIYIDWDDEMGFYWGRGDTGLKRKTVLNIGFKTNPERCYGFVITTGITGINR